MGIGRKTTKLLRRKIPCLIFLVIIVFITMGNLFNGLHKDLQSGKRNTTIGYMIDLHGNNISCSSKDSSDIISYMCKEYTRGTIDGSLCNTICYSHDIIYQNCTKGGDNKDVLVVKCKGVCEQSETVMAVLKSENKIHDVLPENQIQQIVLDLEYLQNKTSSLYGFRLTDAEIDDFIHSKELLKRHVNRLKIFNKMFGSLFDNPPHSVGISPRANSLWRLLTQQEFRFLAMNQDVHFVPRLYGTCGGFYVTEYTPAVITDRLITSGEFPSKWKGDWAQRVNIALRILSISYFLDNGFHKSLHFCDMTGDIFGMNAKNEVKILDTDSLYFSKSLESAMKGTKCKEDKDCFFFDCTGMCNATMGHCVLGRQKSNLQKTCEDIFFGGEQRTMQEGLLYNPPKEIVMELHQIIEDCVILDQKGDFFGVWNNATQEVYINFTKLLQKEMKRLSKLHNHDYND